MGRILVVLTNGNYGWCSASVVVSNGSRMLASAGHCVMDASGNLYKSPLFIPQYEAGKEPLGRYVIDGAFWYSCYRSNPTTKSVWDFTFFRTAVLILPKTGGLLFQTDVSTQTDLTQFGYPGEEKYGGFLFKCSGKICDNDSPWFPNCDIPPNDQSVSIGCVGAEGVSGGPVIGNFGTPSAFIAGVLSYDLIFTSQEFATYFSSTARSVFVYAENNGA